MSVIRVACTDQVLAFENTPVIASGGIEENFVQFTFCSAWDGFEKTAVFWRSEAEAYHNMLDESNSCQLPPEVTGDEGVIYFGVFGVNAAGCQRTSNVLSYRIDKGAITIETQPSDPTPDIYTQLLAKYNEMIDIAEDTRAKEQAFEEAMTQRMATHEATVAAGQAAFEETMTQKQTDHEAAVDADQKAFEETMTKAQEEYEQHILDMIAAGLVPDGSITAEKLAPGVMIDAYTKTETLTDETREGYGLDSSATPDDVFKILPRWRAATRTEIITTSGNWEVPNVIGSVHVRLFGAGGGGGSTSASGGGGGGGHMAVAELELTPGEVINVTIGEGGAGGKQASGGSGGASAFGAYLSADGGGGGSSAGAGGSGGSGGGGGSGAAGGSGSYGGGGGASGSTNTTANGGNGGTFGCGGGGFGAGGTGGTYGGNGGAREKAGKAGTNTIGMGLEFEGEGLAGALETTGANYAGGSGGGGYGGNGGKGGDKSSSGYGGGGGGYGANGGDGHHRGNVYTAGGGGGGGYGGPGGTAGNNSTSSYGGGGGGGYGTSGAGGSYGSGAGGFAAGGAGAGNNNQAGAGGSGICVLTYTYKAIV